MMKERPSSKLVRGARQESRRFRLLVIVVGFFLVSLTFVVVSKPEAILFGLSGKLPVDEAPASILIQQPVDKQAPVVASKKIPTGALGGDPKVVDDEADVKPKEIRDGKEEENNVLSEPDPASGMTDPTHNRDGSGHKSDSEMLGEERKDKEKKVTLPTVSNYTIHDADDPSNAKQEGASNTQQQGSKPLCDFSNFRANVCEMRGDVRIHPKATSVLYMEPEGSQRDEVWKIKPYPRKGDEFCLSHITELTVKSSKVAAECTKYHEVPAVIFSLTGYTGNLFHDFTDVMVPLFTTASEFNGEVQFLITDMALWWTIKYHTVLEKLSKYPIIDFSKDDQVHCFKHAIVGLHSYMEFTIDATKSPHGVTMVDFNRFMRGAYSLGKDTAVMLGENPRVKPRLLIIKRHRTRMFLNLDEIIAMAEGLGFEVVIDEANVSSDISGFAKLVNSVDVMMGVHGAGLTNCVFLPQNATLIQIVPWGGLDWISRIDFGDPAEMMGLRYKQYAIGVDESSLTDQYPRDHEIFKNPISFHKRGFEFIRHTFMDKQNVKLDCKRFRPILLEALDNLNP
ncbi:alpha-1,3-arabinosyltransferase XAT3-like isoform X2 [Lolium rigidum]|uniref:alpha-1,3-arabinosyltransferase XAT3-like isoform X2 n=1 Tax=Lolium rigidum TaxID=89674 RepID=UPI001F5E0CD2|nr:alpha-1,3-arabinosyltransferase XAT3-like isoform X2 [Lolium rigidum]